jgi:DNA repair exonuclease SbcCD ATPase subunit
MLISELSIKGFKSYGNNEQILKLNTKNGELILLVGSNGSGKSSLIESFDFSLYGKVRGGKSKKWSKLSTLPNRINGELLNRIKFESLGTEVEIKRGVSPNILELWENGVLNDKAGKANLDSKIEKYIGMDIETFKSFISMNIDIFKNFISLSNEEKQLLLDKLFNLEVINILNGILKDIVKNNKVRLASFDAEIRTLDESIESIKISIEKAIEKEKENIQQEIDTILSEMNSKKEDYKILKEKVEKVELKETELLDELDNEKKQYLILQNDIKNVQKDIDLYDSGKCPVCKTEFNSDHFLNLRSTLIEKKKGYESIKIEIENNINLIKERQIKLKNITEKTTKSFNDLTYLLKNYKTQIDKLNLKKTQESGKNSINVQEFQNTIKDLEGKKSISKDNISICKEKELYYKELNRIFSEDGVKKSIISGIIKPINHFISENVSKMQVPFDVRLDETFTAEIRHLGSVIEHDSLSTGETKLINISILVAYLKLIRCKKFINILFLDEVFSSIDIDNINKILMLLKSFANEYNINIFVVHHALLNKEMFDRIIKIEKNIFSQIIEED